MNACESELKLSNHDDEIVSENAISPFWNHFSVSTISQVTHLAC